jgi:hypothetical protein
MHTMLGPSQRLIEHTVKAGDDDWPVYVFDRRPAQQHHQAINM